MIKIDEYAKEKKEAKKRGRVYRKLEKEYEKLAKRKQIKEGKLNKDINILLEQYGEWDRIPKSKWDNIFKREATIDKINDRMFDVESAIKHFEEGAK